MAKAETDAYAVKLLKRYSNTAMKHRTYQIAMDGSQKLPQRLLGTISDRLRAGAPIERLSLTLAAWMIYAQGKDFAGKPIVVQDPLAAEFAAIDPERLVEGYLSLERIFPRELAGSGVFREAVERKVELLKMVGVAEAVRMVA